MDDSGAKKVKIKVVDIIKKPDKKAATREAFLERRHEKSVTKDGDIGTESDKKEIVKKKTDDLEKLFEKIDRKEREVLGKNVPEQIIEREIPHLRGDSIRIPALPKISQPPIKKRRRLAIFAWGAVFILLIIGIYGSLEYLPKSDIRISVKKFRWDYDNPINLSFQSTDIDVNTRQIPIAIFSQKKNTNFLYPASGKKYVERKASGNIVIYNAYSADNQILVSGTRFKAPDGKIFKLVERVTVPGAKIVEGKIVASNIEAQVAAEKAGEQYNIGIVSRFTIPGFEGTAKFDKFYAESKTAIGGGFIGEAPFPTDNDIKIAKGAAETALKNSIKAFIISQIPADEFKIIDTSEQFKILKETVNTNTDDGGNFSVFVEGEFSISAFKKAQMLELMTQMAKQVISTHLDLTLKQDDYSINYGSVVIDPKSKTATLPVKFSGVFWQALDANEFRQKISGKSEAELKAIIYSYPNIEKADFSFWPFWVSKVPINQDRVRIIIN